MTIDGLRGGRVRRQALYLDYSAGEIGGIDLSEVDTGVFVSASAGDVVIRDSVIGDAVTALVVWRSRVEIENVHLQSDVTAMVVSSSHLDATGLTIDGPVALEQSQVVVDRTSVVTNRVHSPLVSLESGSSWAGGTLRANGAKRSTVALQGDISGASRVFDTLISGDFGRPWFAEGGGLALHDSRVETSVASYWLLKDVLALRSVVFEGAQYWVADAPVDASGAVFADCGPGGCVLVIPFADIEEVTIDEGVPFYYRTAMHILATSPTHAITSAGAWHRASEADPWVPVGIDVVVLPGKPMQLDGDRMVFVRKGEEEDTHEVVVCRFEPLHPKGARWVQEALLEPSDGVEWSYHFTLPMLDGGRAAVVEHGAEGVTMHTYEHSLIEDDSNYWMSDEVVVARRGQTLTVYSIDPWPEPLRLVREFPLPPFNVSIVLDGHRLALGNAELTTGSLLVYDDVLTDAPPRIVERFDALQGESLGESCAWSSTDLLCGVAHRTGLWSFSPTGGVW